MEIELTGRQRKYLRGLAHSLKPIVLIGQMGLTDAVAKALDDALNTHELVKIKFNEDKDKAFKRRTIGYLEKTTGAVAVGMIGHTSIFYRPHPDKDKRNIVIPAL